MLVDSCQSLACTSYSAYLFAVWSCIKLRTSDEAQAIHDAGMEFCNVHLQLTKLALRQWVFQVRSGSRWFVSLAREKRFAWFLKPKLHLFKHMLKRCLQWRILSCIIMRMDPCMWEQPRTQHASLGVLLRGGQHWCLEACGQAYFRAPV